MFPSFEIFGRQIGLYGIMVVVGGFVCAILGSRLIKRYGFDVFDWSILLLSIGAGIFLGAHILFSLTNIQTLILTFQHIGELWFDRFWELFVSAIGGMVFYGGFLGGLMYSAGSAAFSAAAATALSRRLASPFTATS